MTCCECTYFPDTYNSLDQSASSVAAAPNNIESTNNREGFNVQPVFPESFPYAGFSAPGPALSASGCLRTVVSSDTSPCRIRTHDVPLSDVPIDTIQASSELSQQEPTQVPSLDLKDDRDWQEYIPLRKRVAMGLVSEEEMQNFPPKMRMALEDDEEDQGDRQYLPLKKRMNREYDVIVDRYPLNRANAAAQLANQRVMYQGGVSAGISGTAPSIASSVASATTRLVWGREHPCMIALYQTHDISFWGESLQRLNKMMIQALHCVPFIKILYT